MEHPEAVGSAAHGTAAVIQVADEGEPGGPEVAFDPITKTFFKKGVKATGVSGGGYKPPAELSKIEACDPVALLNALLLEALFAEDIKEVAKWLDIGADIDHRDIIHGNGMSPLMLCTTKQLHEIATLIIERGADPNVPDENGRTPLHAAARLHDRTMIDVLLSYDTTERSPRMHGTGVTPLHILARDGDTELCRVLLEAGADVNVTNEVGESALHLACRETHVDTVELLVASGADILARSHSLQREPLHYSCQAGSMPISLLLFRKGASPYSKEASGRTAVDVARGYNHNELGTTLVDLERDRREAAETYRVAQVRASIIAEREAKEMYEAQLAARAKEQRRLERIERNRERVEAEAARKKAEREAILKSRADAKARIDRIAKEAKRKRDAKERKRVREEMEAKLKAAADVEAADKQRRENRDAGVGGATH